MREEQAVIEVLLLLFLEHVLTKGLLVQNKHIHGPNLTSTSKQLCMQEVRSKTWGTYN